MSEKAFGYGVATLAADGVVLDVTFHTLGLGAPAAKTERDLTAPALQSSAKIRRVKLENVFREINLSEAPIDAVDAYLRLHLLSNRLVKPHGQSLDGIFGILANVIWTSVGPCAITNFNEVREDLRNHFGHISIYGVDKFPRMVDYVIPEGIRIADADRVRLGAYLSSGTTVMHEGFVNFNAGTLGTSMVEGRISAGVVVGDGSDIGGGASIMGTLSGGGKEVISIGKKCLLGANSGIGISLGDDCVVESGVYITAGSVISLPDGTTVKARELSGASGLLFRRNSTSGALQALNRTGAWGGLNSVLHKN